MTCHLFPGNTSVRVWLLMKCDVTPDSIWSHDTFTAKLLFAFTGPIVSHVVAPYCPKEQRDSFMRVVFVQSVNLCVFYPCVCTRVSVCACV